MTHVTKKEFREFKKQVSSDINDLNVMLEIICSANDEKIDDLRNNLNELKTKLPKIKKMLEGNITALDNIQKLSKKLLRLK